MSTTTAADASSASQPSTDNDGVGGAAILTALTPDFTIPVNEKSMSVNDLLEYWSQKEQRVEIEATSSSILLDAYKILDQTHLVEESLSIENVSIGMQQVATIVAFVRYMFEWQDGHNNDSDNNDMSQKVNKMAISLLQKLANGICSNMKQASTEMETVACFTLGSLLRSINPLVSTRPFLLSPLWKGICSICSAFKTSGSLLPCDLAQSALQALSTYLRQGQVQLEESLVTMSSPLPNQIQQLQRQIKVLVFLVARAGSLLPVTLNNANVAAAADKENNVGDRATEMLAVLLRLRGLELIVQESTLQELLQPVKQLGTKVDACLTKVFAVPDHPSLFHEEALDLLLRTTSNNGDNKSFALGKLLALQGLLERAVEKSLLGNTANQDTKPNFVPCFTSICEELLFSTLPLCHEYLMDQPIDDEEKCSAISTILGKTIETMSSALVLCDVHIVSQDRSKLYGLFIRWLSPCSTTEHLHPLTRESIVSLMHIHLLWLCPNGDTSPRSVTTAESEENPPLLLIMLVKLVLDSRTKTSHRRNIATVLTRAVMAANKSLKSRVQHVIASELEGCLKPIRSKSKKRKQQQSFCEGASTVSYQHFCGLTCADMHILGHLLEGLSIDIVPSMHEELKAFCELVLAGDYRRRSSVATTLVLSLLTGQLQTTSDFNTVVDTFQRNTGVDLTQLRNNVMEWIIYQCQRREGSMSNRTFLVVSSALRFIKASSACLGQNSPIDHAPQFGNMLAVCVKKSLQTKASVNLEHDDFHGEMVVVFELISLLGEVGSVISPNCQQEGLQAVANAFMALFETKSWPIVASAMTSLVKFAATLAPTLKHILPVCLPAEQRGLLQSRAKNSDSFGNKILKDQSSESDNRYCANLLMKLIPDMESRRATFSSVPDITVDPGSYILRLPTMEGRSALVVFPPGNDSIRDIEYMLDGEVDNTNISVLQRMVSTQNGSACRLVVKKKE